jgi:hypothetical protein
MYRGGRLIGGILVVATLVGRASAGIVIGKEAPASKGDSPIFVVLRDTNRDRPPATNDKARDAIWNSPEMLQARGWLDRYFAVSARTTPQEAQRYMDRLRSMTPDDMKRWLAAFKQRQGAAIQSQEIWDQDQQLMIAENRGMLRQQRRGYDQYNNASTAAALRAQARLDAQVGLPNQVIFRQQEEDYYRGYYGWGPGTYGYPGQFFWRNW